MRTLVIETATAACSVALLEDGAVLAAGHDVVGRGHAERLLPMIAALPGGGRAARILVDCGPGSFTGVRVGIAAARALALGWGAQISGYSSLSLLAVTGFHLDPGISSLAVILEGGHGEVFMQTFEMPLRTTGTLASLRPDIARADLGSRPAIGSGVRLLGDIGSPFAPDVLPRAADARLLPETFTSLAPTPLYGRAPDARPAVAA